MTYLITGANKGIGLELCRQLHRRGATVLATCRTRTAELDELGVEVFEDVEVSDEDSVASLARRLDGRRIDVLINNAGILVSDRLEDLSIADVKRQFEVNALGPLMLTRALLPRLAQPAKVVLITSRMGSIGDNGSGGYYGYRMSKAALNAAGVSLARDLAPRGISVAILHPGMVATPMTGHQGVPVEDSVRGLLARIDEAGLQTTGTFRHANGEPLPW